MHYGPGGEEAEKKATGKNVLNFFHFKNMKQMELSIRDSG
jgi:cytochrome b involved in lipid metabolism